MRSKIHRAILSIVLVFLILRVTGSLFASAQVVPDAVVPTKQTEASKTLPSCPLVGPSQAKVVQSVARHHRVFLSWNASAPSPKPEGNAAGYCLYRSHTQNAAKQKPPCADCDQVNTTPISGTSCVDDLVDDGAVYYYLLLAVNSKGKPSDWSNEAPAHVPSDEKLGPAPAGPAPPACRQTVAVK